MRFKARDEHNGNISFRFVSHNVTCEGSDCSQCREGGDNGQQVRDLADAIHSAIEEDARQRAKPSGLVTSIQYDDSHSFLPDGRIDAGKSAELVISVENRGVGTAYQVVTSATANQRAVLINGEQTLGDIAPGQKRETRLPIAAALDLAEGEVTISIDARERQRGYGAHRTNITIPTVRLKTPRLLIDNHWVINDGNTGFAHGNGNSKPESGETFELLAFVRNEGVGPAVGVELSATSWPSGIEPILASDRIGVIQPGETKQGKLAFGVPRNWTGSVLDIQVRVSDARGEGVSPASRNFELEASILKPALSAAMRAVLNGHEITELTNGQIAELEITPQNDGEMEADDVVLRVSAPGVTFKPDQINVGTIRPHDKQLTQHIQALLPRGFAKDRLRLLVELSQKDFSVSPVIREFVVKRRLPDLRSIWLVRDSADKQTIEQNQTVTLELNLTNHGSLAAQEVTATIEIRNPSVKTLDELEAKLGNIAPGAAPSGAGTDNLGPLGEAGNTARLHLESAQTAFPNAQASAAVNSLGLLDLVQIAAEGLAPKTQYQVYLADSDHAPFGQLELLAVLKTNPDGGGIVQTIGPLKTLASGAAAAARAPSRRFLIVTELNEPSKVVLRHTATSIGP
ncbi:MAG TPA: hypothetical protein VG759_17045 [Candidatus Angelobacter sp.]|nr:hypothetical protein [Candidatus Angelobacter sp.]